MILTPDQTLVIVVMVMLGTITTRALPFILFHKDKNRPYLNYLGKVLPQAVIGMLVVYCLKGIHFKMLDQWIPAAAAILCIAILHMWKKNTLLSIGGGTFVYMLILRLFGIS